jgi:hypothetical protein
MHKIVRYSKGFAAAATVATVVSLVGPANSAYAATSVECKGSECSKHMEIDVVNLSSSDVKVKFASADDLNRGGVKRAGRNGFEPIPDQDVTVKSGGERSSMFSFDFMGKAYLVPGVFQARVTFNNQLDVVASRAENNADRSIAVLEHRYDGIQTNANGAPISLPRQDDTSLKMELVKQGGVHSGEFAHWYRLVISDQSPGHPSSDLPWKFAPLHNITAPTDIGYAWRSKLTGLRPNTDYQMSGCSADIPQEITINGRRYNYESQINGKAVWLRSSETGEIVFTSPNKFTPFSCMFRAAQLDSKVTRLTGDAGDPVFRVDIAPSMQVFDGDIPANVPMMPYEVWGIDGSGGSHEIGKVMPISRPEVDRAAKSITAGGATFYFENKQKYTKLEVRGQGEALLDLSQANAPKPPTGLQDRITSIAIAPLTQAVTSNGLAQEPMKLKLLKSGHVVNPADEPELAKLYDYVYYRDDVGNLITGMYGDSSSGYTSVSRVEGSYVNDKPYAAKSDTYNQVYLSTTETQTKSIKAVLGVEGSLSSAVSDVTPSFPPRSPVGSSGYFSFGERPADPKVGALYYVGNGSAPRAGILTRYKAMTADSDLPMPTPTNGPLYPFFGQYILSPDGNALTVDRADGLDGTSQIKFQAVLRDGTHVKGTIPK